MDEQNKTPETVDRSPQFETEPTAGATSVVEPTQSFEAASQQPQQPEAYRQPQQPAAYQQPQQPSGAFSQQPQQPYGTMPQQPPMYGQPMPGAYAQPPQSSGKAVAALVLGIFAILTSGSVILGIIFGIIAIVLAGSYIKQTGKDGKAVAGRICGIVGIVLSVLSLVLYLVMGGLMYQIVTENDTNHISWSSSSREPAELPSVSEAEPSSAEAALIAKMNTLVSISDADIQKIAAMADEDAGEQFDTLTNMGVNPEDYARWMTEGITYEVINVRESGDSASSIVYIHVRDVFQLLQSFSDKVSAYIDSPEFRAASLNDSLAYVGNLFRESMDEVDYTVNTAFFELEKENGEWVVDEDDWEFEIDYMFGLA